MLMDKVNPNVGICNAVHNNVEFSFTFELLQPQLQGWRVGWHYQSGKEVRRRSRWGRTKE